MKHVARCEWVAPITEFDTQKGEHMKKCEVKFQFCDEENFTNLVVFTLFNKAAESASRNLRAGEIYDLSFRITSNLSRGGREFLNIVPLSISKDGFHVID